MKYPSLVLLFVVVLSACVQPISPRPHEKGDIDTAEARKFSDVVKASIAPSFCRVRVEQMKALAPDQLRSSSQALEKVNSDKRFNAHDYFSVLKHLSLEPDYILDYQYSDTLTGGEPILFALLEDEEGAEEDIGISDNNAYLRHIQIDGTPEGFFEFVALDVMGEQFYLWGHARYNDWTIICDDADMDKKLDSISLSKKAQHGMSVQPSVQFSEDIVRVQFISFTNWGGFYENTYSIRRNFPHTTLNHQRKQMIPYDVGIEF